MSRKAAILSVTALIVAAVFMGLILVNKGDGPIMGMILSDKMIATVQDFENQSSSMDSGIYLNLKTAFNKLNEESANDIPAGKDLFASFYMVECPKGIETTVKWTTEAGTLKEETKRLETDRRGIISYLLDRGNVRNGNYTLELYIEGIKKFEHGFTVR